MAAVLPSHQIKVMEMMSPQHQDNYLKLVYKTIQGLILLLLHYDINKGRNAAREPLGINCSNDRNSSMPQDFQNIVKSSLFSEEKFTSDTELTAPSKINIGEDNPVPTDKILKSSFNVKAVGACSYIGDFHEAEPHEDEPKEIHVTIHDENNMSDFTFPTLDEDNILFGNDNVFEGDVVYGGANVYGGVYATGGANVSGVANVPPRAQPQRLRNSVFLKKLKIRCVYVIIVVVAYAAIVCTVYYFPPLNVYRKLNSSSRNHWYQLW